MAYTKQPPTANEGNDYYQDSDYDLDNVTDGIGATASRYLQDPSLTKEQLDQKKVLETFEHRFLKSEEFVNGKWKKKEIPVRQKDGSIHLYSIQPKANEIGVPSLVGMTESAISMNTLLSNMDEEEARAYIAHLLSGVLCDIYLNYDTYEIKASNAYAIFSFIENLTVPGSIRGREGFTARFISRIFGEKKFDQQKDRMRGFNL